jgi:hypothetical protein
VFTQIPEEVFDRLAMSSLAPGFRGQSQERRRPLLTMTRSIVDRETISDRKRIVCSMFQECGIFADFCNQTYCHEHQTGAPEDERNSHRSSWQDVVTEKSLLEKSIVALGECQSDSRWSRFCSRRMRIRWRILSRRIQPTSLPRTCRDSISPSPSGERLGWTCRHS